MKHLALLATLVVAAIVGLSIFVPRVALADGTCEQLGEVLVCKGTATSDDELLFTTGAVLQFDACMLLSHAGSVDVEGTLNGTDWSDAIALEDRSATTLDKVLATTADGMFAVVGKYQALRVRQNGATGAEATMICWDRGT